MVSVLYGLFAGKLLWSLRHQAILGRGVLGHPETKQRPVLAASGIVGDPPGIST